jgi:hypothetical protein
MNSVVHEKKCSKCGESKPLDAFWKAKKGLFGRRSMCRDCASADNKDYRKRTQRCKDFLDSKVCPSCRTRKPASDFTPDRTRPGGLKSNCRKCLAERTLESRRDLRREIGIVKESSPCVDCGRFFPYWMMQFDHVNGDKSFMISSLKNKSDLPAEIAKCEVVCSGCHANRTYYRMAGFPVQVHVGSDKPYGTYE